MRRNPGQHGSKYGGKITTKEEEKNVSKVTFSMYFPQVILLTLAFVLGIYLPEFLDIVIRNTIVG